MVIVEDWCVEFLYFFSIKELQGTVSTSINDSLSIKIIKLCKMVELYMAQHWKRNHCLPEKSHGLYDHDRRPL